MSKLRQEFVVKALSICSGCPAGEMREGRPFCAKGSVEILFFEKSFHCPAGQWKSAVGRASLWNPARAGGVATIDDRWSSVKPTWLAAEEWVGKAKDFAQAVTSGKAEPAVVERRRLSCFGDGESPACPNLVREDGHAYCGACGCGKNPLARLDGMKLEFATLKCPLQRPGFSNAKVS